MAAEFVKGRKRDAFKVGDIVSVRREYFDAENSVDGERYSDSLPPEMRSICGRISHKSQGKARIKWDIDGKFSDVPLKDLQKERQDKDKLVSSFSKYPVNGRRVRGYSYPLRDMF